MKLFYSDDYVAGSDGSDTTSKAQWVAESLARHPVAGVELVAPTPVGREALLAFHSADYVDALETGTPEVLAASSGFAWTPETFQRVCASTGGVVDAALDALRCGRAAGSLSSGLHHARRHSGGGFCAVNGLVVAAEAVLQAGAKSVVVVDFDAHCGGGTHSLLTDKMLMVDVSTTTFDGSGHEATCVRAPGRYLDACRAALRRVDPHADLWLYNAGMDSHEDCDCGGLAGVTTDMLREREELVFSMAGTTPVAFVLAGGYTGSSMTNCMLVGLHRLTISAAAA